MITSQKRIMPLAVPNPKLRVGQLALFNEDGTPFGTKPAAITALAANATPNAVPSVGVPTKAEFDAVVALANSLKVTLNQVIAAIK